MNGMTKSILLQVAFKEAVTSANTQGLFLVGDVKARTLELYDMLVGLHEQLGINPDEGRKNSGGGGGNARPSKPTFVPPASSSKFIVNGETWIDYRTAKDNGDVKKGFPDFKSEDGKESVYLYDLEGNANPDAAKYVQAAELEVI